MKKLVCRKCGNDQFYVLHVNETLCKCGARLNKLSDYRAEWPPGWKKHLELERERQAEIIARISLLKRQIDKSLEKRDQAGFKKLTNELKACEQLLRDPKAKSGRQVNNVNGKMIT
ncbi:IDEAL domain-containing protein [Neobacillus mesonae]|uniref:IDEAL domain-containing protein n=1 Tax=Neobacillus mesonae TaxID=1193713 RepID=A0A3Q9QYG4_9BACI|nr:IDEAL domain-containing protein [Neobacillus mesonae]AZU64544.1 IDEAL domain-containing protein [Neobacillus mesonae]MED4202932.1 IDEAL domain-containing protein [Neobacillus mesonae]